MTLRALAILATCLFAPAAWAQGSGDALRDLAFTEIEKRLVAEHFGVAMTDLNVGGDKEADDDKDDDADKGKGKSKDKGHGKDKSKGLPPGLAKRDALPPGLQKRMEKHGSLPPGLAKRDLPADLAAKMPKRDDGQEVTVVDDDVVLVDKATGVIIDVIKDVVSGKAGAGASPDGTLAPPKPQSQGGAGAGSTDGGLGAILKGIFGGQ
ncbi:MAG: hypothetical protein HQL35_13780 [Alphaproteobacteria bacterium]|nr:hypothetical protein [Alphaproteobacteria bacterium]